MGGGGGQLESIQLRGMGPQTGSPTGPMSASAESGLWVSEISFVTRDPVLWVSALLVSLVLRHLPLWLPTAESSCKVGRWFFGIPDEPRTTFPEAGSRPLLSHWPRLDHLAFLNQYMARRLDYPQPRVAFPELGWSHITGGPQILLGSWIQALLRTLRGRMLGGLVVGGGIRKGDRHSWGAGV